MNQFRYTYPTLRQAKRRTRLLEAANRIAPALLVFIAIGLMGSMERHDEAEAATDTDTPQVVICPIGPMETR